MLRYCTFCESACEFSPSDIASKKKLMCPVCGNIIDKNSRHPSSVDGENVSEGVGGAVSGIFRMAYIYYVTLSVIGIICYYAKAYSAFHVFAAIVLISYILQLITSTSNFISGVILVPLGAVIGFFTLDGIDGALLGVLFVFLIRHIIRDIFLTLLFRLIDSGSK